MKAIGVTLITLAAAMGFALPTSYATELGETVTNIATMSYPSEDGERVTVETNPAIFQIEARRTPSTIEFFRFAPNAPSAINDSINGSDYAPSGRVIGPFSAIGAPRTGAGSIIDLTAPIALAPASTYATGELMFVRVIDEGQNGNPNRIETVTITLTASTGDEIVLRLYESGPDTGEFWAYVPSTRDETESFDNKLTTGSETMLTATYIDSFDETEVSIDTALVDPYSRVFNALTGDLVDNAMVTIMNAQTGLPATVLGVDGLSTFPSSVITGQRVSDSSGFTYDLRAGEFRFPMLMPGEYYITVETPEGYSFSSIFEAEAFGDLLNGPFDIADRSYGERFNLTEAGPLNFDVPLDPETDIVLAKSAEPAIGDVGDFITYTVSVENRGQVAAPMLLHDIAPQGFRYLRGSSRLGGLSLDDPAIERNGRELRYMLPILQPGDSHSVKYIMQIGADVSQGERINSAVILDGFGAQSSNIARAGVTIREDLLRSTSTLIGRVTEQSCDADQDWARNIETGIGVEGVRLYLETGAYTLTDEDGLYHFEGLREGTHVVQVDEATLPRGYVPMMCEENSQYADNTTSKFIDVKGGGIWRANFYLERTGEAVAEAQEQLFDDVTEYKTFDTQWLNDQSAGIDWVYPSETRTPSAPSVNIGIKHGPDQTLTLALNGHDVPMTNFQARDSNATRSVMLSRWRGVDILDGQNVFIATVKDSSGATLQTLRREIYFIKDVARATPVIDQSRLIADGRTSPVLAIRIEDEAGRPVHAGRKLTVDVQSPYRLESNNRLENSAELVAPLSSRQDASVGPDGIARIHLEPTLQTGNATVTVTLDDGRKIDITMYLQPEKRDWIVVGLAEGSIGLDNLRGQGIDLSDDGETFTDGRVAFFAKGLVKGDWLMTLAVDTDKRRGNRDGGLFDQIDPNAYYTLYGDRSYQDQEAASRYPVYLKLEKKTFFAMFGDYSTNMIESKLGRYSRALSGFKTEYSGERFDVVGFAAQTNQGFAKDEIAANGTSGPYKTDFAPILANSEVITIETRDRFRPDVLLDVKTLQRHLDYSIDYLTGEIIFRLPVDVTDAQFNPNVIVVDYETSQDAERNISFGGRAAVKFNDGKIRVGASYIHEEGRADKPGGKQDLLGVDLVAQIAKGTELRAEYAISEDKTEGVKTDAAAYLAEVIHTSENLAAEAYIREEQAGFGVGQQGSNTAGVRRVGAAASYKISEDIDEESGRRVLRDVRGQAYTEENLETGAKRQLSEVTLTQEGERMGGSVGLRHVKDDIPGQEGRDSMLVTAAARLSVPKHGFTVTAAHEQPISGDDAVSAFPQRTTLGLDKTITSKAAVSLRHEILDGAQAESQNTVVGVTFSPWAGTDFTAQSDMLTSDSARRLGATVGVDQQWRLNEKWSVSTGLSQRKLLEASGAVVDVAPDAAISPVEQADDYMTGYLGLGYRTDTMSASGRVEARAASNYDSYIGTLGVAREMSETLSLAGIARAQVQERHESASQTVATNETRADLRLGVAYRPRNEDTVIFDRLDMSYDKNVDGSRTSKVVNNFAANTMINDRWQLTGNYGVKFVQTDLGGVDYSSVSHLIGAETRFDITERIDIGLHGSMLTTDGGSSASYSYGPSIGFAPLDNTWISVGYNVSGYRDDDFEAAEYAREGAYIKLRLKFDQDTTRSLLKRISPAGE